MIYVLIGVIVLLVIILVAMGIALWQGKDYVYTREEFYEEDNKKFMELTSLYTTLLHNSFKFETKYNIGDNIWYVKDNKTYQGKIKTITTELFKTKNDIKATQYIYLLECGNNTKESEIICVQ